MGLISLLTRKKAKNKVEEVKPVRPEDFESKEDYYRALAEEPVYTSAFVKSKRKFKGTHSADVKRKTVLDKMKFN